MNRLLPDSSKRAVKYVYKRLPIKRQPFLRKGETPPEIKDEIIPREKKIGQNVSNASVTNLYDAATSVKNKGLYISPYTNVFYQLLDTVAPATDLELVDRVHLMLKAFRDKTAPIMPKIEFMHSAMKILTKAGQVEEAHNLLQELSPVYGLKVDDTCYETMALAYIREEDNITMSRKFMENVTLPSDSIDFFLVLVCINIDCGIVGMRAYDMIISSYFEKNQDEAAWNLFDEIRGKVLPSPSICGRMVMRCGKLDQVEKAFRLHQELSTQGMLPSGTIHASLIYAASRRKTHYSQAMELFRQMQLMNFPIRLSVYNNVLSACSKVADLETAMEIWRTLLTNPDPTLRPNEYSCSNYLWAMAAVETLQTKISNRDFVYSMSKDDLIKGTVEVFNYIVDNGLRVNGPILSSVLANYSNLGAKKEAEALFWDHHRRFNIMRSPFVYELMFKLYDNIKDYNGALQVYTQFIREKAKMPYEGWRALVRSAALCDKVKEAVKHLEEMNASNGVKPHIADFTALASKVSQLDRMDLWFRIGKVCLMDNRISEKNPFVTWMKRSNSVAALLKEAYGKDAPESATKIQSSDNYVNEAVAEDDIDDDAWDTNVFKALREFKKK